LKVSKLSDIFPYVFFILWMPSYYWCSLLICLKTSFIFNRLLFSIKSSLESLLIYSVNFSFSVKI
jgi:hypothetical protein